MNYEYCVVRAFNLDQFELEVNEKVSNDWKLQGSIVYTAEDGYVQGMTRGVLNDTVQSVEDFIGIDHAQPGADKSVCNSCGMRISDFPADNCRYAMSHDPPF